MAKVEPKPKPKKFPSAREARIVRLEDLPPVRFLPSNHGRKSPYLDAVAKLVADPGAALAYVAAPGASTRYSLRKAAKKLNVSLLFAELDGMLYARLAGEAIPVAPATTPARQPAAETPAPEQDDPILALLHQRPMKLGQIHANVRDDLSLSEVRNRLQELAEQGAVRLGANSEWALSNGARAR